MNSKKRAAVTGATGFIGSHMCRHLLDNGWEVAAIVRPGRFPIHIESIADDIVHFETDGDINEMAVFFNRFQPSTVFHFAARYVADHGAEDVAPLIADNVLFGASLLEAMRLASVPALVHAGTAWQNSRPDEAVYAPANLYAATKQAFEDILRYYVEARIIRAVGLRIFDTYGEDDHRKKLLQLLLRALLNDELIGLTGGEQEIDPVHVSDVCSAFETAGMLLLNKDGGALQPFYGVSSGRRISVRELGTVLEKATGRTLRAAWGERPYREREVMRLQTCYPSLPGWQPLIPLETGIRNMWEKLKESNRGGAQ